MEFGGWCCERLKYENLRVLGIIEGIEKKKWRKVDGFWMKEDGKGVKGLEGIGLIEVETWEGLDLYGMFESWELGVLEWFVKKWFVGGV